MVRADLVRADLVRADLPLFHRSMPIQTVTKLVFDQVAEEHVAVWR